LIDSSSLCHQRRRHDDGLRVEGSVDRVDRPGERGAIRLMRRAFTPGDVKLGKYRPRILGGLPRPAALEDAKPTLTHAVNRDEDKGDATTRARGRLTARVRGPSQLSVPEFGVYVSRQALDRRVLASGVHCVAMERDKCVGTQSYKQRERRHDDADIIELTDDREKVRKNIDRPDQIGASDDRDRLDHRWHGRLSN
jgi:hypothetical protein